MKCKRILPILTICTLAAAGAGFSADSEVPQGSAAPPVVADTYPGLASGGLSFAKLGDLPEGVLLRSGSTDITSTNLEDEIGKAPESAREGLKKNGFFMLEQIATKKLVLELAKQEAAAAKKDIAGKPDQDILDDYVQGLMGQVQVGDDEIARFYAENKDACGGATLDQMKNQIKPYVLKQKQQDAVAEHVRTLGRRMPITVSAMWVKEQAASAKDNPVDKARGSGKPTMVDFGASGCRPCDMMTPVLADLKKKYEGKINVLFVHVREDQILAARYGIQSIPVQVFFDKTGKEIYRHTGFFPQADIEKKLGEMGVQ
jgi:thioredoxin 1